MRMAVGLVVVVIGCGPPQASTPPAPASSAAESPRPLRAALLEAAALAGREGRLDDCIANDIAILEKEDDAAVRLHLASCEERAGKLVNAVQDARRALEMRAAAHAPSPIILAEARAIQQLVERIPRVSFAAPPGLVVSSVAFDARPVPLDKLDQRYGVDPGKHTVTVEGAVNGEPVGFDREVTIAEREVVAIPLEPPR